MVSLTARYQGKGRPQRARRIGPVAIAAIIAFGCLCLVAHTATDLADLKMLTSPQHVRLEPPEHGQVDNAYTGSDLAAGSSEDGPQGTPASLDNQKDIEFTLRI